VTRFALPILLLGTGWLGFCGYPALAAPGDAVSPGADGSLLLGAADAVVHGSDLKLDPGPPAGLGFWDKTADYAAWTATVPVEGLYDLHLCYALAAPAGGNYQFCAGGEMVSDRSKPTKDWGDYEEVTGPSIHLHPGLQQLNLRPDGDTHGGLMNLRWVKLVPEDAGTRPGPDLITADQAGRYELLAAAALVTGKNLHVDGTPPNLSNWNLSGDFATWTLTAPAAGSYRVIFEYACNIGAGGPWQLTVGDQDLIGVIKPTANWGDFQRLDAGGIDIKPGQLTVTLKPAGDVSAGLMNLRSVTLVPVP